MARVSGANKECCGVEPLTNHYTPALPVGLYTRMGGGDVVQRIARINKWRKTTVHSHCHKRPNVVHTFGAWPGNNAMR